MISPFLLARVVAQPRASAQTPNTIVGRVTDSSGAPVRGALVTLVVREARNGQIRFHPVDGRAVFFTDADGRYRIDSAPLGDYYVVAVPQNPGLSADGRPNRNGFRITYHPSAATVREAVPVTVNVRASQTVNITALPARLSIMAGTVFTSTGQPAAGGTLRVTHGDNLFGFGSTDIKLSASGAFSIAGVPPGTYFLHFSEGPWPPPRSVEIPLISGARVVVSESDLTNIRVTPIHMVRATGRVIIAPASRADFRPGGFTVGSTPIDFEGNPGPQRPGLLRDDLTFEFRTWPGPGRVRVFPEYGDWTIASVHYGGADVTRTGIDFRQGVEISGIEVELARRR